ncbi:hypothetical protein C8046_17750 [Serinibacter arcticus]|uniref:Methionine synthase n=1 Tax=Serinibacter arcticus TaxID=1655435 RepID=A0A2U1ZZ10_9MICO|nr:hypothetical protein [Serinibacter arcticus]PWD52211.1 hypothetical protein C8046_17750 [Serinibacter arcticus]
MRLTISGLGAWPGDDALAAHQAVLGVLADAPSGIDGLPHLAVLPARGPWAAPIGRTLAMLESMPATLEPHGWRLASAPSGELERAGRTLRADVESYALAAAGHDGVAAVPVLGPLSLAASLWLPVGERVAADPTAVADLAGSLALGVARHLEDVAAATQRPVVLGRSRGDAHDDGAAADASTPAATIAGPVLLHEPLLGDVLAGRVSRFTGAGRLRPLDVGPVTEMLRSLVAAWAPHPCVVVVLPDAAALRVAAAAGPAAVALDVTQLDAAGWEALAEVVESGVGVWATSVPHRVPGGRGDPVAAARGVLDPWRSIGLGTESGELTLTARPGLGTLAPSEATASLRDTAQAALALAELLA